MRKKSSNKLPTEPFFIGSYHIKIDSRHRIPLPSEWSIWLKKIIMNKGSGSCLELRSPETFKKYSAHVSSAGTTLQNNLSVKRIIIGSASNVHVDDKGRMEIPSSILQEYGFHEYVCLIGLGDFVEMWDPNAYESWQHNKDNNIHHLIGDDKPKSSAE